MDTRAWPGLTRLALEHGVAPLLHLRLRGQRLPEDAGSELARLYRANTARNLLLARESEALEAALRAAGVAALPLKGPQLAQRLYADMGARQVADLDLLIRPEHLPAADGALTQIAYARVSAAPLARLQECRDVLYVRERPDGSRLFLDLHLRLRPYGGSDALAGRILHEGMTRENLLPYLCLNLLTHRWARLQPWLDLASFLRLEGQSLDGLLRTARAKGLEWTAGVFFSLSYAAQLAGTPIPAEVLSALRPGWLEYRWVESILGGDARETLLRSQQLAGPRGAAALLGCERGLLRKLRLAAAILFPPAPTLRQMDAHGADLPLVAHYFQRIARRTARSALPNGGPNRALTPASYEGPWSGWRQRKPGKRA